ncbi:MAG: polyphosphate kinase [Saprospiraceae bacterium]|jgi:polyphosphate kinase
MKQIAPYIHRDISWLDFNYRVLQEAKDPNVPLFDRLKFLAIYSSNLDEFFRVRVANNRNLLRIGKKTRKTLGFEPADLLTSILKKVNGQQLEFSDIFFKQIVPELKQAGIKIIRRQEMTEEQSSFVEDYFFDNLLPYVQPVILIKNKIKPFLNNGSLYLTLDLVDKKTKEPVNAIVKVPSDQLDRFIQLPNTGGTEHIIIMIDDVVRHSIPWIFPGYDIMQSYSIKLTRDAELYIDDEFSGDLLHKIQNSLRKRAVGPASRLVYDRKMPEETLNYLMKVFDLTEFDLLPEGRYHNNYDFFGFMDFGKSLLKEASLEPIEVEELEKSPNIFDAISERDHLIHPPYHSYESVIRFFEEAAEDPDVSHIKIVQYRVAAKSRIMEALIKAAQRGKQVTAFVEIKARFDEEANITWGAKLQKAGVKVYYSIPGIKVHAKTATVIRREGSEQALYCYLSTGNFHEKTANVYSDIGLFTKDKRLTSESIKLFNYLETKNREQISFEHMGIGLFNLNKLINSLINKEIKNAKAGKPATILLKMNSLQDPEMIEKLYAASQAGVKIELIIRGICSLVPGVPELSDNINAISIVDRYLEHARIFIFHNGGDQKFYFSSADWMYRNLNNRVEIMVPIFDDGLKDHISNLMDLQLNDNIKARSLNYRKINKYIGDKGKVLTRSQMETYLYIKRKEKDNTIEINEENTIGSPPPEITQI